MKENILKVLRWLPLALAATVVLNAAWEWLFKPSLVWAYHYIVEILKQYHFSYFDEVYRKGLMYEIRYSTAIIHAFNLLILIMLIGLFIVLFFQFPSKSERAFISKYSTVSKYLKPGVYLLFFGFSTILVLDSFKTLEAAKVYEATNRLVQIHRPDLTEKQYLEIRASMLQVYSHADYFKVLQLLAEYSPDTKNENLENELKINK